MLLPEVAQPLPELGRILKFDDRAFVGHTDRASFLRNHYDESIADLCKPEGRGMPGTAITTHIRGNRRQGKLDRELGNRIPLDEKGAIVPGGSMIEETEEKG